MPLHIHHTSARGSGSVYINFLRIHEEHASGVCPCYLCAYTVPTLFLHSHIHQLKTLHYLYNSIYYTLLSWCGIGKMVKYSSLHACTALSCINLCSVALALILVHGADHDP